MPDATSSSAGRFSGRDESPARIAVRPALYSLGHLSYMPLCRLGTIRRVWHASVKKQARNSSWTCYES